jgi:hypothetical protein
MTDEDRYDDVGEMMDAAYREAKYYPSPTTRDIIRGHIVAYVQKEVALAEREGEQRGLRDHEKQAARSAVADKFRAKAIALRAQRNCNPEVAETNLAKAREREKIEEEILANLGY